MDALKLFYEEKLEAERRRRPEQAASDRASAVVAPRAAETGNASETLLCHVELHAGRTLRTREAIDAYFETLATKPRAERPAGRSLLRETALVLFLLIAVLQYYYMDVSLQIASLKNVTVFVPVEQPAKRRTHES